MYALFLHFTRSLLWVFKVLSHYFSYVCAHTCHGICMEVSCFSLFAMWTLRMGLGWVVRLGGSAFDHWTRLTAPSLPFLNPILQLASPQEILVKACTIISHMFFINCIASMLVLTYPLVCIKHNFENPLAITKGVSTVTDT